MKYRHLLTFAVDYDNRQRDFVTAMADSDLREIPYETYVSILRKVESSLEKDSPSIRILCEPTLVNSTLFTLS